MFATVRREDDGESTGVCLVIDFCLNKEMVSDPETNYSCLQLVWASKANCDQRRGEKIVLSSGSMRHSSRSPRSSRSLFSWEMLSTGQISFVQIVVCLSKGGSGSTTSRSSDSSSEAFEHRRTEIDLGLGLGTAESERYRSDHSQTERSSSLCLSDVGTNLNFSSAR